MDEVIKRIKGYVLVIDPKINNDDLLDFSVADVVDRALAYMNRVQLLKAYEDGIANGTDPQDLEQPIPLQLERTLASVVAGSYKSVRSLNEQELRIKSISDNGQSITYSDTVTSYLGSKGDEEIFSSSESLLKRFRLPKVIENTGNIQTGYWG